MKILIIGLGSIARKHIAAIRQYDGKSEILALRSKRDAADEVGVKSIYNLSEIDFEEIGFAVVSNPTSEHRKTIENLIEYKIPLFIEKPVFNKIGDKEEKLLQQIEQQSILTYVACNLRFLDCIQFIKKEIHNKRINEVNVYCGSYLPDWRPNIDFKKGYSANKKMGGGVHIDLIHELDYTFWLFGTPKNTDFIFRNRSSLKISAYDYANYRWQYDHFTVNVILNYYRRDPKRTFEIVIDEGTDFVNLLKNNVVFNNKVIFASEQDILNTYFKQMNYFFKYVLTNSNNFNTIKEGYKVLNLCLTQS